MLEEEIKALQDAKVAAETRAAEVEALLISSKEEADKARGDLTSVVDELKEERLKKNEALSKANLSNDGVDVNALIESALQTRDTQYRETSLKEALSEFKANKSEFQNDTAGLVSSKFEEGLKRFNFADVSTKEQMKARLEDVYKYINFKPGDESGSDYSGSSFNANPVAEVKDDTLKNVASVLETTGVTEDKYKALRTKYPDAFGSLGLS